MAVNYETTSNIEYIGGDTPSDGKCFGHDSLDKIAFHGSTPIVQATVAATTTTTATTTALQADVDAIRTALQNLGLIA